MSELAKALGPALYQQVVDEAQAREVPVRTVLRWCVERSLPQLVPLDQPWTTRRDDEVRHAHVGPTLHYQYEVDDDGNVVGASLLTVWRCACGGLYAMAGDFTRGHLDLP